MSPLYIKSKHSQNATLVSNRFLDIYMPEANGEFVKIYLYLLRAMGSSLASLSLAAIADIFNCTENDIDRALRYWAKKQVLELETDGHDSIVGITFLPLDAVDKSEPGFSVSPDKTADDSVKAEAAAADAPVPAQTVKRPPALTAARVKELKKNEEIVQLLFIAEKYLGKTLSPSETSRLLYFYEELHFSADLIEYLIEYCVSKGSKSIRYIEKVALAWHESKITTVEMAKQESAAYSKNYFMVLKALGISSRNPVDSEIQLINRWINEYGFTIEIITEACGRTIAQTGKPSFPYADGILSSWHKKAVHSLSDIEKLDKQHRDEKDCSSAAPKQRSSNKFNNFPQREYDFSDLEKQLLSK